MDNSENRSNLKSMFTKTNETGETKLNPIFFITLGAIILIISIFGLTYKNAQEIYVGNNKIGVISGTKLSEEEITNIAIAKIKGEEGTNIQAKENITLKNVRASKSELISLDYALYEISKVFGYTTEGATINVDGKDIVTLASEEEANKVLQTIKDKYISQNDNIVNVDFVQDVRINKNFVEDEDISTQQVAIDLLTASTNQEKKYQIKEGDTLYQVAIDHNIKMEDLLKANPDITENTILKIGQEINLVVPIPLVSVKTIQEVTYNETIKRTVEKTYNDSKYKTYSKIISEGADGEKTVVANVTKINGIEESKQIISEKVILEPVVQTVEVGTLNTPPKAAIGNFIYPVSGRISSGYGYRGNEFHKGIDFSATKGTSIKASDGGTVVFSGWYGGYGNLVKIDHGNGFITLYGHNSENIVSVGQKVAQGEVIAYVGSTGDSTGNHLHFEIIKNGASQNPMNYLK